MVVRFAVRVKLSSCFFFYILCCLCRGPKEFSQFRKFRALKDGMPRTSVR